MKTWTERADKAANFLAETDEQVAELKVKYERDKRKVKAMYATIYLHSDGTVDERKSKAEIHPDHDDAVAAEMTSLKQYEILKNRRETARIIIDFWRSYNKAQQEGVV